MALSQELAETLAQTSFADCVVTVVGCGHMGKEFIKALQFLKVPSVRVCSRSQPQFEVFEKQTNITTFSGGYRQFQEKARPNELAIIATPIPDLIPTALHLRELGYKCFLIEKPIALTSSQLQAFRDAFVADALEVVCAYNRVAYPSFLEARHWIAQDGGATSCHYTFTELVDRIDPKAYPSAVMSRWGIANSLHVMSMAHGLIGLPERWSCYQGGENIAWHPAGSVFVGSGISEQGISFAYHADWGSTGRWSVEAHTPKASYRLCPLERLFVRHSFKEDWKEVPISAFAPEVKVGFVEQVAALLNGEIARKIPLLSLEKACRLTEFGEEVFGYGKEV